MPWSANSVAHLPLLLSRANSDDCADHFVARDDGTDGRQESAASPGLCRTEDASIAHDLLRTSHSARLDHGIGMTDTSGQDLYQDLALFGLLKLHILNRELVVCLLENGGLVGLGE